MSGESAAASEAPSLGAAIKRAASSSAMPMITEDSVAMDDDDSNDINDMLDEALDVSVSPSRYAPENCVCWSKGNLGAKKSIDYFKNRDEKNEKKKTSKN